MAKILGPHRCLFTKSLFHNGIPAAQAFGASALPRDAVVTTFLGLVAGTDVLVGFLSHMSVMWTCPSGHGNDGTKGARLLHNCHIN